MDQSKLDKAIKDFMHPTVYTGVKPVLLVAEELLTKQGNGQVVEAVWVGIQSAQEFSYISKFAVAGKIVLGKYYNQDESEHFRGRLALANNKNVEKVVLHRSCIEEIKKLKSKISELFNEINRDFDDLLNVTLEDKEIYFFEKKDGDWKEELFSDFNINVPYKVVDIQNSTSDIHLYLENPKTRKIDKCLSFERFYGYFVGSQADIAGLKLKSESYLKRIASLENDAKILIKQIDWLDLDNAHIKAIVDKLPEHPFEEYFNYVDKDHVRNIEVPEILVDALKNIILKHMPENNTPLGMEYIPIDKLLYLFHMIIPRDEALLALERCDIVYEPPGMLLGFEGERKLPPKFLVPIRHVASAYQRFPSFVSVCNSFIDDKKH